MYESSNKDAPTVLYISNLHESTGFEDLSRVFARFGVIRSSSIRQIMTKTGATELQYGNVVFFEPAAAAKAKAEMNGFMFRGKPMVVGFEEPAGFQLF